MIFPKRGWLLIFVLTCACSSQRYLNSQIVKAEEDFKDHIGFVLYDPVQAKIIYSHQGDRYFQPASNTKIFTLYASFKILGDSIPALQYVSRGDSLIFWGTGAPGFLYDRVYQDSLVWNFLKRQSGKLFFSTSNFYSEPFGPGWAWDDYNYGFQPELSPFPMYGNIIRAKVRGANINTAPAIFKNYFSTSLILKEKPEIKRESHDNRLVYFPGKSGQSIESKIPFHYSDDLFTKLLTDTLGREVTLVNKIKPSDITTIYSLRTDSLYKVMMQQSDNFIAEQLLLACAGRLGDSLKSGIAIRYVNENFLINLQDKPIWVDGSGLSRYNLFTPRTIVTLWDSLYTLVPHDRLFSLLAIGGRTGTLKNYFKANEPFVFGKTGSFNNNHALSGYLVTKKGHTLIFSWMNNNFASSTTDVRKRMEAVLTTIYEKY